MRSTLEETAFNPTKNKIWLRLYASILSLATLFVIGTGAVLMSQRPRAPVENQVLSSLSSQQHITDHLVLFKTHTILAYIVLFLSAGLVVFLFLREPRRWLQWLGGLTLAIVVFESVRSEQVIIESATLGFLHAYLAHLFFSLIAAIAVFTSQRLHDPELVEDRLSLRNLAIIVPCLVLLQIALGAAYRYQFMGVLTHIFGAFFVAIFVLLVGVVTVKQYPGHRLLRPAAIALMSIAGLQILLGFAAFITRLMTNNPTLPVVISTSAHVITGTLTLAASVVLAIQLGRNVAAKVAT